jgi:hypothetical protein
MEFIKNLFFKKQSKEEELQLALAETGESDVLEYDVNTKKFVKSDRYIEAINRSPINSHML